MNKRLLKIEIIGFVIVCIAGSLGHFFFKWSGQNQIVGLFFSVNESPWEHLKLIFFPFFAYTVFTAVKLKQDKFNVFFANCVAVFLGMWSTLSYFYTFTAIIGEISEFINISSFIIGVAIAFVISYFLINNSVGRGLPNSFALIILILMCLIFFLFTFKPPYLPLFLDPQTKTYSF